MLIVGLLLAVSFPVWAAPVLSWGLRPVVVSVDGKDDFRTVQAALNNLPAHAAQPRTSLIKNGTYREKIAIGGKDHLVYRTRAKSVWFSPNR